MNIKVYNLYDIGKYTEKTKHIVISIETPSSEESVVLPDNINRLDILRLRFHDFNGLDREYIEGKYSHSETAKRLVFFNEKLAEQIVRFVKFHQNSVTSIICHCEAGISRSAGCAAALSKCINGDDEFYFKHYLPNTLVYKLIIEEWNK